MRFSCPFSRVFVLFCPFLHFLSIPGTLLDLLYYFKCLLAVWILGFFWNWKIKGILILISVCNSVQQNITMRKIKRQIFCWQSGNSLKRKTTPGQPNPGYPLFRRQSKYINSNTHIPDAAIVSSTLMCNPTRTRPNQVSYLKGSSMESFTLGPTLKRDQFSTLTLKYNSLISTEFNTEF